MQKRREKLKILNNEIIKKKNLVSEKSHRVTVFAELISFKGFKLNRNSARGLLLGSLFSLTRLNYRSGNSDLLGEITTSLKKKVQKKFYKRFLIKQSSIRLTSMISLAKIQAYNVSVIQGILHFKFSSRNNSITTLTDLSGNVKACCSGGLAGFKGSNKSTKYAKDVIIQQLISKSKVLGYSKVILHFIGARRMRRKIIKMLRKAKIRVVAINILSRSPHNGCRSPKIRRI